ncbi:dipeptidase [Pseudonocardia acaciae]|uniref:dipeptidase n=1 Tax=Pseudonocardia acaciae TaxID=551276 RepID=UPI00048CD65D|nr:membrane dipeptidase [Pseudonocardia acaciae]
MRYDGYTSFSYLTPGRDYRAYDLAPELNRVAPYDLGLSEDQAARAERLLRESMVISLHDHPQVYPADLRDGVDYAHRGRTPLAYLGLSRSGLDAVFDNLAGPTGCITSHYGWTWTDVLHDIGMRLADVAHQDYVTIARTVADLHAARADGRLALVLGLEAATPIENNIDRLDLLYGFGVRQLGVVYNEANLLGGGLAEPRDGGLTRFGRRAVERMNKLGMAIDLSHAGDRTSMDAIAASERPVLITHAGARAVWPTERMKPDHVLRALAESGGLLGIEAAPHSTLSPAHPRHSIESVMDHFTYCVELMGIEHVTFGPDTLYGDHVAVHHAFAHLFAASKHPTVERVPYCAGMENPTENFRNVIGWLVKHGYRDDEIAMVVGGNTLRVLNQTW